MPFSSSILMTPFGVFEKAFVALFPVLELLLRFVLADAVSFLAFSGQLVPFAGDDVKIIVGELAPLLFDFALELFPVPFYAIPIHGLFPLDLKLPKLTVQPHLPLLHVSRLVLQFFTAAL